jgi:hypothetical protein
MASTRNRTNSAASFGKGILFAIYKTILEGDVVPFDPAVFLYSLNYGLGRP